MWLCVCDVFVCMVCVYMWDVVCMWLCMHDVFVCVHMGGGVCDACMCSHINGTCCIPGA